MELTAGEREAQKLYWKEHSTEATVEAMMLDSKAADIDKLERPEVRHAVQGRGVEARRGVPSGRCAALGLLGRVQARPERDGGTNSPSRRR